MILSFQLKSPPDSRQIKRIPPGPGSKAALRDPIIELIVNKQLGDDGLFELVAGLRQALEHADGPATSKLEVLSLHGAGITTRSLPALSRIIELAADDLRELYLGRNSITVWTSAQAADWETFLHSFRNVSSVRLLDLGENHLGPKAFEILTRVHSREPRIRSEFEPEDTEPEEYVAYELDSSSEWEISATNDGMVPRKKDSGMNANVEGPSGSGAASTPSTESRTVSQQGQSCLHICCPRNTLDLYLVSSSDSVSPKSAMTSPQVKRGLRSIPNLIFHHTNMGDLGALHLSYFLIKHLPPEGLAMWLHETRAGPIIQTVSPFRGVVMTGKAGIYYTPEHSVQAAGFRLLETAERFRSEHWQAQKEDMRAARLWSKALSAKAAQKQRAGSRANSSTPTTARPRHPPPSLHGYELCGGILTQLEHVRNKIQGDALRNYGVQIVELWRVSLTLLKVTRTVLLQSAQVRVWTHARLMARQESAMAKTPIQLGEDYCNNVDSGERPLPGKLPLDIWYRIILEAVDPNNVMSPEQQKVMFEYAADEATLDRDHEAAGKPISVQIWRVLDWTGCLAYDTEQNM